MQTITVEEHSATAAFMDGPGRQLAALAEATPGATARAPLAAASSRSAGVRQGQDPHTRHQKVG
jgi:hypothetical protein